MANFESIAATGQALVRVLNQCFAEQQPVSGATTTASLVRTEDLESSDTGDLSMTLTPPMVSLFLYRVDCNRTMRAPWSAVGHQTGRSHLPIDLHFLLTPWGSNARDEYAILGRCLQCFEDQPILGGPWLVDGGGFEPGDSLQVTLTEMTTEEIMRTFDTLPVNYKLSVPYLVRVVRIDGAAQRDLPRVTTLAAGVDGSSSAGGGA